MGKCIFSCGCHIFLIFTFILVVLITLKIPV
uniref:Uncharacterized protein n=1 Tax=Anguilla anguilla TaxID=7936 RepID=A0A0E9T1S2_ANGAN